jgi:hypothetical protein
MHMACRPFLWSRLVPRRASLLHAELILRRWQVPDLGSLEHNFGVRPVVTS